MITKDKPISVAEKFKSVGPWLKFLVERQVGEYQANSAYIDAICPDNASRCIENSSIAKLEKLVKTCLINEFGSDIQNSESFDYLVHAVMNKMQKKDLVHFKDDPEEDFENDPEV